MMVMLKLITFLFAFAIVFAIFIGVVSGIINYISHLMISVKEENHYWVDYHTLLCIFDTITHNGRITIVVNDPTASLAYSFLIVEEYIYKSSRIVRATLGERVVWVDDYYMVLYPLSWIRYNVWLTRVITEGRKELGLKKRGM